MAALPFGQVVFSWARRRQVAMLFTSSYVASSATPYGAIKRLGEQWCKTVRKPCGVAAVCKLLQGKV